MADKDLGSLYKVTRSAGVQHVWHEDDPAKRKVTGKGVGVALIDSGVARSRASRAGKVVNGPDLSFESQASDLPLPRHLRPRHPHGRDHRRPRPGRDRRRPRRRSSFIGVAPDADADQRQGRHRRRRRRRLPGDRRHRLGRRAPQRPGHEHPGAQPLLRHRRHAGPTGSTRWPTRSRTPGATGIVVVVAAGNDGTDHRPARRCPAVDPYVIAVGAARPPRHRAAQGRRSSPPSVQPRRRHPRPPTCVAPGRSIVACATRAPTSTSATRPRLVTGDAGPRFFRGSGTSQAAAVVSGAAALLLQHRPNLTPDQVKALLTSTADPDADRRPRLQGAAPASSTSTRRSRRSTPLAAAQTCPASTGTRLARAVPRHQPRRRPRHRRRAHRRAGHLRPGLGRTVLGRRVRAGAAWSGGDWNGRSWAGTQWQGRSWAATDWTGRSWAGRFAGPAAAGPAAPGPDEPGPAPPCRPASPTGTADRHARIPTHRSGCPDTTRRRRGPTTSRLLAGDHRRHHQPRTRAPRRSRDGRQPEPHRRDRRRRPMGPRSVIWSRQGIRDVIIAAIELTDPASPWDPEDPRLAD